MSDGTSSSKAIVANIGLVIEEASDGTAWNAFISQHPDATCDHLWEWQQIIRDVFRHDSRYLIAKEAGVIVGVLPLVCFRSHLFGRFLVSMPFLNYGGILASTPAARRALVVRAVEIARAFGASHLELRHRTRQIPELPSRSHKIALTLALPGSTDALWAAIDRKARNQVRKAQKEGLTIATGGSELVSEFYQVFSRNMRDLGTPVYSPALFDRTLATFSNAAEAHVVRLGALPIAASITIRHRGTVLVPWASSVREYRHLCANMLLYWTMLERAIGAGATTFDFGRSSPDAGTHHFKAQWGAEERPLHWEYCLLTREAAPNQGPSSPRFSRAIDVWKHLPLGVANSIGPYIVRNIP